MEFNVLEEFWGFTLFYEENIFGGINICCFLGAWAGFHVALLRRGVSLCCFCAWGNLMCECVWVYTVKFECKSMYP
jgi:hypothetical protein